MDAFNKCSEMCEKEMILEAGMSAISEEAIDKIDTL